LLMHIAWKVEHALLQVKFTQAGELPSPFLDVQRVIEFGIQVLSIAAGACPGSGGMAVPLSSPSSSSSGSASRFFISTATLDDVRSNVQQVMTHYLDEARSKADHTLLAFLLHRMYKYSKLLLPLSTHNLTSHDRVFIDALCFHLYNCCLLTTDQASDEEVATSPKAAAAAATTTLSPDRRQRLQLCCFSLWHVLLNNQLHILQPMLLHTSSHSKQSYDLIHAPGGGGFSLLMGGGGATAGLVTRHRKTIASSASGAGMGSEIEHDLAFTSTSRAVSSFQEWLRSNLVTLTIVFDETLLVSYRGQLEKDTRMRLATRNAITNSLAEVAIDRRRKRKAAVQRRNALLTQRMGTIQQWQQVEIEKVIKRRRERTYRFYELNKTFRANINALYRQSVLFNYANELQMKAIMDGAAAEERAQLEKQDGLPNGLSMISIPHSCSYLPTAPLIHTRIPLPYRTLSSSMAVLAEWVRVRFLPAQRFRLDFTEGPFRQRKRLTLHEDFYLNYKIHVPRLQKAIPLLRAQKCGKLCIDARTASLQDRTMEAETELGPTGALNIEVESSPDQVEAAGSPFSARKPGLERRGTVPLTPSRPSSMIPSDAASPLATASLRNVPLLSAPAKSQHRRSVPTTSVDDHQLLLSPSSAASQNRRRQQRLRLKGRARKYATMDLGHVQKAAATLDEAARKELLEGLPRLSLTTLTQITAHATLSPRLGSMSGKDLGSSSSHRPSRHSARRPSASLTAANMLHKVQLQMQQAKDDGDANTDQPDDTNDIGTINGRILDAITHETSSTEQNDPAPSTATDADTHTAARGINDEELSSSEGEDGDEDGDGGESLRTISTAPRSPTSPSNASPLTITVTPAETSSAGSTETETGATGDADESLSTPRVLDNRMSLQQTPLTRDRGLATGGSRCAPDMTQAKSSTNMDKASSTMPPIREVHADSAHATTSRPSAPSTSISASSAESAQEQLADNDNAPVSLFDEYEKLLRLLEPGDEVLPGGLYACSRVLGLDKNAAVIVLCNRNMYVLDHFTFTQDGQLQSIDPLTGTHAGSVDGESSSNHYSSSHANDPLFSVSIVARPPSVPWQSEDSQGRPIDSSDHEHEADRVDASDQQAMNLEEVALKADDIVLHVSKISRSHGGDETNSNGSTNHLSPPPSDPEDPLLSPSAAQPSDESSIVTKIPYTSLREVARRRYSLMAIGLEVFTHDGITLLLVFDTPEERDQVQAKIVSALVQIQQGKEKSSGMGVTNTDSTQSTPMGGQLGPSSLDVGLSLQAPPLALQTHARLRLWRKHVTASWRAGHCSNFAYLMFLNTFAGRSYNDFTQYPVMPWILTDYTSPTIHLDDERIYRDLSKPMGAIGEERAKLFQQRYNSWDDPSGTVPSFHYGTHYSSAATVLYYLIRLEPFTKFNLQLQGGKFDHADRNFYDLGHSWTSASSQGGLSDVKELIPEFFYLPNFLRNQSRLDLGEHQRGGYVGDVKLPPWCGNDPRIFVRLHRKALESPYVSANLHNWIDLIFGYKQRGKAARLAQNCFYYLTYQDVVDVNAITDPLEKEATIAQIANFGQTPHQIFKKPHPQRLPTPQTHRLTLATHPHLIHPMTSGTGNTPQLSARISALYWSSKNDRIFALDGSRSIIAGSYTKYLSWNHADHSLRFAILQTSPRHRHQDEVVAVHEQLHGSAQISFAAAAEDGQTIFTGGEDGLVKIWRLHPELKHHQLMLTKTLAGHWARITCVAHAWSYSLLVTAGADGQVLFYDLHRFTLQRRLPVHPGSVTCVAIDPFRGDVVTAAGPNLYIWDINGEMVAQHLGSLSQSRSESIECVTFSQGPEGAWVDPVILTGHRDGTIRIWRLTYPTQTNTATSEQHAGESHAGSIPLSTLNQRRGSAAGFNSATGISSEGRARADSTGKISASATPIPAALGTNHSASSSSLSPSASFSSSSHTHALSSPASSSLGTGVSLGVGFLGLELAHRLDGVHDSPVTCLHTSSADWKRLWSGDESGRVVSWQISSDEHWTNDAEAKNCANPTCGVKFSVLERRHHCRECGGVYCSRCSTHRIPLEHLGFTQSVRVCDGCYAKLTTVASNANANANATSNDSVTLTNNEQSTQGGAGTTTATSSSSSNTQASAQGHGHRRAGSVTVINMQQR